MARKFGPFFRFCYEVAKVPFEIFLKKDWRGGENLPENGGFIAVANHVTTLDSLTFMHFLGEHGVPPRMMAKAELFDVPVLGWILRSCKQVPVFRGGRRAKDALAGAERALRGGECVGVFPEGTLTEDPHYWPMQGKTGVARLALRTHAPVVPVAQWGAHEVLAYRDRHFHLWPRKTIHVQAMPPVDLTDLYERGEDDHDAVKEATGRIIAALTKGVATFRPGEIPPRTPVQPSQKNRSKRPYKKRRYLKIFDKK
ncbi:MAG: lysophospholipid acyltransferase family protein [Actinomycetaceae bacterium]|nr:lysophospholipid acyltransferase family protein [Actinomycetaceae bacterium]